MHVALRKTVGSPKIDSLRDKWGAPLCGIPCVESAKRIRCRGILPICRAKCLFRCGLLVYEGALKGIETRDLKRVQIACLCPSVRRVAPVLGTSRNHFNGSLKRATVDPCLNNSFLPLRFGTHLAEIVAHSIHSVCQCIQMQLPCP